MATPPGISKQLTDKVLKIVKDNKDISIDDIVLEMKKSVGLSFPVLQKLVNEILEWFEEGGVIVRLVNRRTMTAYVRMNENRSAAGTIVSESIKDLIQSGYLTEMTDGEVRATHDKVTKGGKYLGTDKKFNRHWYEYKGQLWVHGDGSTFMTNNGSVEVPGNKKIINGLVKEEVSEGARETHKTLIRKGVVAPIDSTRHPERKGLEGPFRNKKTGKVFYYDPKEGKYYDADSDAYLEVGDVMEALPKVFAPKGAKHKPGSPHWTMTVFRGLPKHPDQNVVGWVTEPKTRSGRHELYVLRYAGYGSLPYFVYPATKEAGRLVINGERLGRFGSGEEAMEHLLGHVGAAAVFGGSGSRIREDASDYRLNDPRFVKAARSFLPAKDKNDGELIGRITKFMFNVWASSNGGMKLPEIIRLARTKFVG